MDKYRIRSIKLPGKDYWTPGYTKPSYEVNGVVNVGDRETIGGDVFPQTEQEADDIARDYLINQLHIDSSDIE